MSDQPPHPPYTPSPNAGVPRAVQLQTGMAVTALVFGILSVTILPFVASIPAIILGIISLNRVSREPQRYGGKGMAIAGICCGGGSFLCVFPLMISILLPSLSRARELSQRLVCVSNMKGITTTLMIYANENSGQGLPTLDDLVVSGDVTQNQMQCPSTDGLLPCDYVLVPQLLEGLGRGDEVLLYEPVSNHGDDGGNVCFADGHCSFLKGVEYEETIAGVGP